MKLKLMSLKSKKTAKTASQAAEPHAAEPHAAQDPLKPKKAPKITVIHIQPGLHGNQPTNKSKKSASIKVESSAVNVAEAKSVNATSKAATGREKFITTEDVTSNVTPKEPTEDVSWGFMDQVCVTATERTVSNGHSGMMIEKDSRSVDETTVEPADKEEDVSGFVDHIRNLLDVAAVKEDGSSAREESLSGRSDLMFARESGSVEPKISTEKGTNKPAEKDASSKIGSVVLTYAPSHENVPMDKEENKTNLTTAKVSNRSCRPLANKKTANERLGNGMVLHVSRSRSTNHKKKLRSSVSGMKQGTSVDGTSIDSAETLVTRSTFHRNWCSIGPSATDDTRTGAPSVATYAPTVVGDESKKGWTSATSVAGGPSFDGGATTGTQTVAGGPSFDGGASIGTQTEDGTRTDVLSVDGGATCDIRASGSVDDEATYDTRASVSTKWWFEEFGDEIKDLYRTSVVDTTRLIRDAANSIDQMAGVRVMDGRDDDPSVDENSTVVTKDLTVGTFATRAGDTRAGDDVTYLTKEWMNGGTDLTEEQSVLHEMNRFLWAKDYHDEESCADKSVSLWSHVFGLTALKDQALSLDQDKTGFHSPTRESSFSNRGKQHHC